MNHSESAHIPANALNPSTLAHFRSPVTYTQHICSNIVLWQLPANKLEHITHLDKTLEPSSKEYH
jgi:hypothetical protein